MNSPLTMRNRQAIAETLLRPSRLRAGRRGEVEVPPALSLGAIAVGALALGAVAFGALMVGRLVIGRMSIARARIRDLEIDELTIHRLRVIEDMPPIPDDPGVPPQDDVWDPS